MSNVVVYPPGSQVVYEIGHSKLVVTESIRGLEEEVPFTSDDYVRPMRTDETRVRAQKQNFAF